MLAITEDTVNELTRLYADLNNDLTRAFATLTASERTTITDFLHNLVATLHRTPGSG